MTTTEIIAAAREIVAAQSWREAKAKICEHGQRIAAELLRLHDGAEWTATPPTKPGHYWHKDVMEQKTCSVYGLLSCKGRIVEAYTLNLASDFGGFWLRAEPATASAMAALRAERDQLRREVERLTHWPGDDFKTCGELSCDDCNERALSLLNERDRLSRELAEAKAALKMTAEECGAVVIERDQLAAELAEAKAALATQQRCPWDRSLDEICPVHGGPCGQCPTPEESQRLWDESRTTKDLPDTDWS